MGLKVLWRWFVDSLNTLVAEDSVVLGSKREVVGATPTGGYLQVWRAGSSPSLSSSGLTMVSAVLCECRPFAAIVDRFRSDGLAASGVAQGSHITQRSADQHRAPLL